MNLGGDKHDKRVNRVNILDIRGYCNNWNWNNSIFSNGGLNGTL